MEPTNQTNNMEKRQNTKIERVIEFLRSIATIDRLIKFLKDLERLVQAAMPLVIGGGALIDVILMLWFNVQHLFSTLHHMAALML